MYRLWGRLVICGRLAIGLYAFTLTVKRIINPLQVANLPHSNDEKNRTLIDADSRERFVLVAMAVHILWMGIGSTFFTRRSEASARHTFELMQRPQAYNARANTETR